MIANERKGHAPLDRNVIRKKYCFQLFSHVQYIVSFMCILIVRCFLIVARVINFTRFNDCILHKAIKFAGKLTLPFFAQRNFYFGTNFTYENYVPGVEKYDRDSTLRRWNCLQESQREISLESSHDSIYWLAKEIEKASFESSWYY